MKRDDLLLLVSYNRWANGRLLGACSKLPAEVFVRSVTASFPSLRDTVTHIMGAEALWLERWQGRSPTVMMLSSAFPDVASLRARWTQIGSAFDAYVRDVPEEVLSAEFTYRTTSGKDHRQLRWHTLLHVINHGSYHRGQAITLLRQLGGATVHTDLLMYLREGAAGLAP